MPLSISLWYCTKSTESTAFISWAPTRPILDTMHATIHLWCLESSCPFSHQIINAVVGVEWRSYCDRLLGLSLIICNKLQHSPSRSHFQLEVHGFPRLSLGIAHFWKLAVRSIDVTRDGALDLYTSILPWRWAVFPASHQCCIRKQSVKSADMLKEEFGVFRMS